MDPHRLRTLLESVADGSLPVDAALDGLRDLPLRDLGFARVDTHRALRLGLPEVIFGGGKDPAQIVAIADALRQGGDAVVVTRVLAPDFTCAMSCSDTSAITQTADRSVTW